MQTLGWYRRRLASMSAGEIAWRVYGKVRDAVDRPIAKRRARPVPASHICRAAAAGDWCGEIVGKNLLTPGEAIQSAKVPEWREKTVSQADHICAHRLDLFDLRKHPLGNPIQWNYDYKAGLSAPLDVSSRIDYRDVTEAGDCKFVWEPSRHQHWVALGRAYRLTGDLKYAREILDQWESWVAQCPFGYGMQWRSPLELGIRLINWVWAFELIRPSGLLTAGVTERVSGLAYRHLWETTRKYSKYSSANNHRIGEAAGVLIGSAYFCDLKKSTAWLEESRRILIEEIFKQTYADGGTREQATGYHLFSLEFFLLAGLAARRIDFDFGPEYWRRLERMFEFAAVLSEGGELPMFGDADDGYVLDLGDRDRRVAALLAVGATLFERPDWKAQAGEASEPLYWLLGREGCDVYAGLDVSGVSDRLESRALTESGCFVLQSGRRGHADAISAVVDCGELGFGSIAAHGHADALSFVLRVSGREIFVDPGTYDYFTYRPYRNYFRSTRAHNTIVVDGLDQSEPLGLFLWGRRANATCVDWTIRPGSAVLCGEHDGYARLALPVMHRRTLELNGQEGELLVRDELSGKGEHTCDLHLHLAEACEIVELGAGRFRIERDSVRLELELDQRWSTELLRGRETPIAGWVSRGYHRKTPVVTLAASCRWQDRYESCLRIRVESAVRDNGKVCREAAALSGTVG